MLRTMPRLGYLLLGWLAVAGVLYGSWRIPRLPSVLHLVGKLPTWAIVAGAGAWCVSILGLAGVALAPCRGWSKPGLVLGTGAAAIVLVVFPIYLLSQGEGWQSSLGLVIGLIWTVCVLVGKIAFLVHARAERRQRQ